MKLILFKLSLVFLPILKILYTFPMKQSIEPASLILQNLARSIQLSKASLLPLQEGATIFGPISPPKYALSIPPTIPKLAFVQAVLLIKPPINASPILSIISKFSQIVIFGQVVQLCQSIKFPLNKLPKNYFILILVVANSFPIWYIVFCLSHIDYLIILQNIWLMEEGFIIQNYWSHLFYCQNLFQFYLQLLQLFSNEIKLIGNIVQVALCLLLISTLFIHGFIKGQRFIFVRQVQKQSICLLQRLKFTVNNFLIRAFAPYLFTPLLMKLTSFTDVRFYDITTVINKAAQNIQKIIICLIGTIQKIKYFVFLYFSIIFDLLQTVLNVLHNLHSIMIFMTSINGQTN